MTTIVLQFNTMGGRITFSRPWSEIKNEPHTVA
ncbi:hypothetical protein LCGC14_1585610 [marine sediment metagenome]|uniref:Uncharacterized protein n=1 Tax=marine sediment metagenome TaxID=412755 RepID=A0A0F9KW47_9ZZZZ